MLTKQNKIGRAVEQSRRITCSSEIPANTVFMGKIGETEGPFLKIGGALEGPFLKIGETEGPFLKIGSTSMSDFHLIIRLCDDPTGYSWSNKTAPVEDYRPINLSYVVE